MGTKAPTAPRLHPAEETAVHLRDSRVAVNTPTWPTGAPAFRRVLEQILNAYGDGFTHGRLQRLYMNARAADPSLTPAVFLARFADDLEIQGMAIRLLGEAQFVLQTTMRAGDYWEAFEGVLRGMRETAPPYDAVLSYGGWRYQANLHVERAPAPHGLAAMNAPVWTRVGGVWVPVAPDWNTGRVRANRMVASVQLARAGVDVPLDAKDAALFAELDPATRHEPLLSYLDPELRQPPYKTAFTLDTGYSPIFSSRLVAAPSSSAVPSVRNAVESRWELAHRLDDPELIDLSDADLRARWEAAQKAGGTSGVPDRFRPEDAYTQATVDDLFRMALREPGAPQVSIRTWEWEHHRAQRVHDLLDAVIERLGDRIGGDPDARLLLKNRLRYLTGLCEPDNLHLVSRWWHAREDARAALFQRGGGSLWVTGDLSAHTFAANRGRVDRFGQLVVPDDALKHPDAQRAVNPFVAYDPRQLIELLTFIHENGIPEAAEALSGSLRDKYNGMARALNVATDLYGMSGPRIPEVR